MRVAALPDVHGNAAALEAVLAEVAGEQVDAIVFCGDLTWGPLPNETLAIVRRELTARFDIAEPRIAVCGLNPHAGEGGHLGTEDRDVVTPAIATARAGGIDVTGPVPADTMFVPDFAKRFDAIVAMYHDQGLPVLKAASFGHGVNVTLGLPFVRTSVDHGTALDLAVDAERAKSADVGSLVGAVELAIGLAA